MELNINNLKDIVHNKLKVNSESNSCFQTSTNLCTEIEGAVFEYVHTLTNSLFYNKLENLLSRLNALEHKPISWQWFAEIVLESPRIRRELHINLVNYLSKTGIVRDYFDFEDSSALFTTAILLGIEDKVADNIKTALNNCLAKYEYKPSPSDSVTLILFTDKDFLQQILSKPTNDYQPIVKEFIEFTNWLKPLLEGREKTDELNVSSISELFYNSSSFRGVRRYLARSRGLKCGISYANKIIAGDKTSLLAEPWIIPQKEKNSDLFKENKTVLLIEWFLAFQRSFNRELLKRYNKLDNLLIISINQLISDFRSSIIDSYMSNADNSDSYYDWLNSYKFNLPIKPTIADEDLIEG